jgi:hypothetical protein
MLPKKIKCHRNKKFTKIRDPYKTYLTANWKWSDIFSEIDDLKHTDNKFLRTISNKYAIKYTTLKNKYNLHCRNNDLSFNTENRGGSNKIFSDVEDKELYDHIKLNYIDKDAPLTNDIIKEIALNKFNKKKSNNTFNMSDGWCNMFKKRWNLGTQKVKFSKKATKIPTKEEINNFLDEYDRLSENLKKSSYSITMRHLIKM